MGGAKAALRGTRGRAGLRIVATVLRSVVHLLPIARRSRAATEHDVGGGRRRAAPTGGGSITRTAAFHEGPRYPAKLGMRRRRPVHMAWESRSCVARSALPGG